MEIKDGGPAFPQHLSFSPVHGCMIESSIPGMSLRDYFAAKVVVGIMRTCDEIHDTVVDRDDTAMEAYRMADAMIKARGKRRRNEQSRLDDRDEGVE